MLLSAIHAEGPIWKGHTSFNSEINEASLSTDFRLKRESKHDIRWGIKGAYQWMLPQVDTYSYILQGEAR